METKKRPVFGDDRAKRNPWREDRLGVAPLAKRLSHVVYTLNAPYGYVIGINGVWGHGKSTLLNFTCAYLDKYNEEAADDSEKIHVIEFRPWMASGHQDLVLTFFKILSESLGPRENWAKRLWRKALKKFGGSSDAIMDAMAKVAIAVDVGVTKGVATATVSIAKGPIKQKIDEFLKDESLQSAHTSLIEQLEKSGKRFLVTIDDIDRLTDEEVTSIMRMVKTVGQLPNVVYLLSYDRNKIFEAFEETSAQDGPRYAEKIIQHEIELPRPSKESMLRILDEEISFLLTSANPDESRWFTIVSDGIRRWIEKPRDVLRLANAVKFSWPALEGEIDPADLLAMEGLRLFDPHVFNWIRDNRDFLFRDGRYRFLDSKALQPFADSFAETLKSRNDKDQIVKVVSVLFPRLGELLKDNSLYHTEGYHSTGARRGIASEAGYDAYFALNPSPDAIQKRVIDSIVSGTNTEEQLNGIVSSYVGKRGSSGSPMISELIEELRHRFESAQAPVISRSLVNSLFSQSNAILTEPRSRDMFALPPSAALRFLVEKMLRLAGPEYAVELLKSAFRDTDSLAFCADMYMELGRDLAVFPNDTESSRERPIVEHAVFEELGEVLGGKITEAAGDGRLSTAPYFWNLLRVWMHLGHSEEPKRWLSQRMLDDPTFMTRVANGLVGVSYSGKGKTYHFSERPDSALYDFEVICNAARKHLQNPEISDDERRLLQVVLDGTEKLLCEKRVPDGE